MNTTTNLFELPEELTVAHRNDFDKFIRSKYDLPEPSEDGLSQEDAIKIHWMTSILIATQEDLHCMVLSALRKRYPDIEGPRYRHPVRYSMSTTSDGFMIGSASYPSYMMDASLPNDVDDPEYTTRDNAFFGSAKDLLGMLFNMAEQLGFTIHEAKALGNLMCDFFNPDYMDADQFVIELLNDGQWRTVQ